MEFIKLNSYKHIRCRDVFFLVLDVRRVDEEGTHLTVSWCAQTPGSQPRFLDFQEKIIISPEELPNWREYDEIERSRMHLVGVSP